MFLSHINVVNIKWVWEVNLFKCNERYCFDHKSRILKDSTYLEGKEWGGKNEKLVTGFNHDNKSVINIDLWSKSLIFSNYLVRLGKYTYIYVLRYRVMLDMSINVCAVLI